MDKLNRYIKTIDPVLIIEDSATARKFIEHLCIEIGLPIDTAADGKPAIELIRKNKYSIFIIDMILPDMDGYELISAIKEIAADPVILVQTVVDTSNAIINTLRLGVFDYIIKPIDSQMFKKTLLKAVEYNRLKQYERHEMDRYKKEIFKVREIQASSLPDFKSTENFDITFSMLPAEDLSGDFLDGIRYSENNTRLIVCDVAGHGIATSYIGNEIRSLFRIFQKELLRPSEIIQRVNNDMTNNLSNSYYLATAATCDINAGNGEITYSSAGHPPSLLYHADQGKFSWVKTKGTMLGVLKDAEYLDTKFTMESGDILLMYSDGITEAWSGDKTEMFGEERLINAMLNSDKTSSNSVIIDVLSSYYEFTDYSIQEDDITIICIKKL